MEQEQHELVIVISGGPHSGKTTLGRLIADTLGKFGFPFVLNMDKDRDEPVGLHPPEKKRLASMGKRTRVRIQTVTTK